MQAAAKLVVRMHTLGVQTGEWCDDCLFPSAAVVTVVATTESGRILSGVQQIRACHDCGRQG